MELPLTFITKFITLLLIVLKFYLLLSHQINQKGL